MDDELLGAPPRYHHYMFAHIALRDFCASNTDQLLELVTSDEKDAFIDHLWNLVCDNCDNGETTDIVASDIKTSVTKIDDKLTFLVQMPEAKNVPEAIMVAIVFSPHEDPLESLDDMAGRYFVLELAEEGTVLCEWSDDTHLNFGHGTKPDVQDFLAEVEKKL